MTRRSPATLAARVAALEARLRGLERDARPAGRRSPEVDSGSAERGTAEWVVAGLRARVRRPRSGAGGKVAFGGAVFLGYGAHYEWQGDREVAGLLAGDWEDAAVAFAALGHRVRLEIVRALLAGVHEVADLAKVPGMGTSGQLYHHLRQLQAGGWVRLQQRNRYVLVPDRAVAALILVGALRGTIHAERGTRSRSPASSRKGGERGRQ